MPSPILTQALIDAVASHIREHNSVQTSYRVEGVSDETFSFWLASKEEGGLGEALSRAIQKAEAEAEMEATGDLISLCREGHAQAILWRQERRYGWGKNEGKAPKEGSGEAPPQVVLPRNGRETPIGES